VFFGKALKVFIHMENVVDELGHGRTGLSV
jgi:hypothetical protein